MTSLFIAVTLVVATPAGGEGNDGAAQFGPARSALRSTPPVVVVYQPPVDAPVIDPFRPPSTPYGPGNRGLEFATVPGTLVRAAADGEVVFAGPVAGSLHVTVAHADGIRTSYSFLAAIRVRRGDRLSRGDVVGVAASVLHVGARRGEMYIDPASLWSDRPGPPHVRLVPLDGAGNGRPGSSGAVAVRQERLALVQQVVAARSAPLGVRLAAAARLLAAGVRAASTASTER